MISNEHLSEEMKVIEDTHNVEKDTFKKLVLKGIILIVKLLRNCRTNDVLIMKKLGVEMIKPKGKDGTIQATTVGATPTAKKTQ